VSSRVEKFANNLGFSYFKNRDCFEKKLGDKIIRVAKYLGAWVVFAGIDKKHLGTKFGAISSSFDDYTDAIKWASILRDNKNRS
jgi:hypothetical protein